MLTVYTIEVDDEPKQTYRNSLDGAVRLAQVMTDKQLGFRRKSGNVYMLSSGSLAKHPHQIDARITFRHILDEFEKTMLERHMLPGGFANRFLLVYSIEAGVGYGMNTAMDIWEDYGKKMSREQAHKLLSFFRESKPGDHVAVAGYVIVQKFGSIQSRSQRVPEPQTSSIPKPSGGDSEPNATSPA